MKKKSDSVKLNKTDKKNYKLIQLIKKLEISDCVMTARSRKKSWNLNIKISDSNDEQWLKYNYKSSLKHEFLAAIKSTAIYQIFASIDSTFNFRTFINDVNDSQNSISFEVEIEFEKLDFSTE